MEKVRPHFEQYYLDGYTFEETAMLISANHGHTASVSAYKKLPRRWNLPGKNFSAAEKEAQLATASEPPSEHHATHAQGRKCPQNRLKRWQRDRERHQRVYGLHQASGSTGTRAHAPAIQANSADRIPLTKAQPQRSPCSVGECPERVIKLPDASQCLTQAVHYIQEYCLFCAWGGEVPTVDEQWSSPRISSLTLEEPGKLLPWRSYSQYYQAFEMLDVGNSSQALQLMVAAGQQTEQALLKPTLRLLSDLLWICFIDCSYVARGYLERTLRYFVEKAKGTACLGPAHPLSRILEAVASIDLTSTDTKAAIARQLVERAETLDHKDFDGVYEARELFMKLLIGTDNLDEAIQQCQKLLDVSIRMAGSHCDYTYRVRRWQGRILAKQGLTSAAEDAFRSLLQDSVVNADSYVDSAARKEWIAWEDLSRICFSRRDVDMAQQYTKLAFEFSVERYGECSGNTLRILADLIKLYNNKDDILTLENTFPKAFNALSRSSSG
ncbi:hypothetical protein OHC33_010377 [Knufia fluminis]|uniref:Clr5 domain-containing protein n=1 Tax=Knufia fluminis TaxID=191047 RepID=A0AAN8E927_9EURO|nr:hypothetical protein OHC33_010377 [Knufia fluminis]